MQARRRRQSHQDKCWLFLSVDTVQTILGHSKLDHAKPYLSVRQETIRRAFEVAL